MKNKSVKIEKKSDNVQIFQENKGRQDKMKEEAVQTSPLPLPPPPLPFLTMPLHPSALRKSHHCSVDLTCSHERPVYCSPPVAAHFPQTTRFLAPHIPLLLLFKLQQHVLSLSPTLPSTLKPSAVAPYTCRP